MEALNDVEGQLEIGLKEDALTQKAEPGAAGGESRGCSEDMSQERSHGPGRAQKADCGAYLLVLGFV